MPEFTYNASALGAGGVIERQGVTTTIPSLASVALAPTGGEGTSIVENYYSEELAFSRAETRVFGAKVRGDYTTSTYVLIENLRVFNRVEIAQMRAVVVSAHPLDPDDDYAFDLVVSYRDVVVDGIDIAPEIDVEVRDCKRYADFQRLMTGGSYGEDALTKRFGRLDDETRAQFEEHLRNGKAVRASVVKEVRATPGFVVPVPGLGEAVFGELMLKPGRRRLNLLRMKFDRKLDWRPSLVNPNEESVQRQQIQASMHRSTAANFTEGPEENRDGGSMTIASVEGKGSLLVP